MGLERYKKSTTDKSRYFWNMTGSLCSALSSVVLLSIVSRINGAADGGVFSLAFSTGQLLYSVGVFEARALQSTDVTGKYSFQSYFSMRILTCGLMILCGCAYGGYIYFRDRSVVKTAAIIILCIYKTIEAFSDVFQGLFQLNERIDLAGKELTYRVLISTATFFIVMLCTHNLLAACCLMVIASALWFVYYDIGVGKDFSKIKGNFDFKLIFKMFVDCFPLFIGSFMLNYIVNAPKYAIDKFMTEEIQNVFGFLVMPAFVINLFSLFFFRPLLTKIAFKWNQNEFRAFNKMNLKCTLWIFILTILALIGAYALGIPILNLFSGQNLNAYRIDLLIIMLGGGANAAITLFYYILACMRKQYYILIGYAFGFFSSIILSNLLVKAIGVRGGCIAYAVSATSIVIPLAVIYFVSLAKEKRRAISDV